MRWSDSVVVKSVKVGLAASNAGIRPGDQIVLVFCFNHSFYLFIYLIILLIFQMHGRPVKSKNSLVEIASSIDQGSSVPCELIRGTSTKLLFISLSLFNLIFFAKFRWKACSRLASVCS